MTLGGLMRIVKIKIVSTFELFFKNLDSKNKCKNKIEDDTEKYAVYSAIQSLPKSIFRPIVFPETTRQRGS